MYRKSIVKLISFKKITDNHHVPHVSKQNEMLTENDETKIYTEELKAFEVELNSKINIFISNPLTNGKIS